MTKALVLDLDECIFLLDQLMKVLIVEDNLEMRRMIRDLIAPLVAEIYQCGDGDEAVDFYRRFDPDWILMDIDLPNSDGLTAARKIISEYPKAKIVMVTDYDEQDMRQAAEEAGAIGYVLKDDLSLINKILEKD